MDAHATVTAAQQLDPLQLLTQVDSFYNGAWNRLLIFITIAGLLVPYLIQLYQKKIFDIEAKKLEEKFTQEQKKLKEHFLAYQTATDKELAYVTAGIYHVQALHMRAQHNYAGAIKSITDSILPYYKSGNFGNFKKLLNILEECINLASAQDIRYIEEDYYNLDTKFTKFQSDDKDRIFSDEIIKIKRALKATRAKT